MNDGVADGTAVTNQATVNFTGVTTGFNLTDSSNPVTVIVNNEADLAVTKVIDNPTPNVGEHGHLHRHPQQQWAAGCHRRAG